MATLEKLHAQSETVKQEYEQTAQSLEQARAELEALYASSGSISERMRQKDVETDEARKRLTDAQAESSQREAEAAVLRANREAVRRTGSACFRISSSRRPGSGSWRTALARAGNGCKAWLPS